MKSRFGIILLILLTFFPPPLPREGGGLQRAAVRTQRNVNEKQRRDELPTRRHTDLKPLHNYPVTVSHYKPVTTEKHITHAAHSLDPAA